MHHGDRYDNAFLDGERMVFGGGDGNGEISRRFTASLSVIGHELAHGVTHYTAGLVYRDQVGACNESIPTSSARSSTVFKGKLRDRRHLAHRRRHLHRGRRGLALRSLRSTGTAYDDDLFGEDPQPAHFDDDIQTDEDDGGVHLNSGIPTRAFYFVAESLGGNTWERDGQSWYDTVNGPVLTARTDFAQFSAATVAAARERYGAQSAEMTAVTDGWASGEIPARPPRFAGSA